jgi:beta-lactam-binding protein with PASTA domain
MIGINVENLEEIKKIKTKLIELKSELGIDDSDVTIMPLVDYLTFDDAEKFAEEAGISVEELEERFLNSDLSLDEFLNDELVK